MSSTFDKPHALNRLPVTRTETCRACKTPLISFFDFGMMPLANGFLFPNQVADEKFYHLVSAVCPSCFLVQLLEQPMPDSMFHDQYPFFTSSSKEMTVHFQKTALEIHKKLLSFSPNPFVIEIGSNDGTFLHAMQQLGSKCLGIEPSQGPAQRAKQLGLEVDSRFFNPQTAASIQQTHGNADLIYAANAICHISDIHSVFTGIKSLLQPDGFFIFEDPYWLDVLEKKSIDQIYDEHAYLFHAHAIEKIASQNGLKLFHAERINTHGGSLRYFLCADHQREQSKELLSILEKEQETGLNQLETYHEFRLACLEQLNQLHRLLTDLTMRQKSIAGYAATSKSTTLLHLLNLNTSIIPWICDSTPEKQGKLTPGTHIPIVSPKFFHENYPDCAILFAYNHEKEIFEKETDFRLQGKQWISYVPSVRIL